MPFLRRILIFFALISIISCSASYEELMESNFTPENEFSKYLMAAYKEKAEFEAKEMHDWNSAKLYSEKALKAAKGEKIYPEHISYWKIPLDNSLQNIQEKRLELMKAYNNLMIVYEDALLLDSFNLAKAITSLDCWSEQQEENWQIWDINKCRDDYLDAMHTLYNIIATKQKKNLNGINSEQKENLNEINSDLKKDNDSAVVVTQNNNDDILQIIYFDFDKSKLSSVSINKINNFVKKNKDNISNYLVLGHTDTKGTNKYNQLLSLQRAKAVKIILIELGINSKNIKIMGMGETELKFKTLDEVAHPANRRAEISPLN